MADKIEWHTEQRELASLKPSGYNPRQATGKQQLDLAHSLQRFSLADPIIINTDGTIIGGHLRHKLLSGGNGHGTMVDVRVPNRPLTPEEERELNIRLNKNLAEWDWDALANFSDELLKNVGFESQELDRIFKGDPRPNDDELPEERTTDIKQGDMFELDRHILLCGDATSPADVSRLMGSNRAEMVFTDPPYNVAYEGRPQTHGLENKRRKIANDDMTDEAFREFIGKAIANMISVTDGAFYVCMSSKELSSLKQVFEAAGGHWQSFIIWVKSQFTLSRADYQNIYESILYGWANSTKNHYFVDDRTQGNVWYDMQRKAKFEDGKTIISIGGIRIEIDGKVTGRVLKGQQKLDIWYHDKPSKNEDHPTMKPVALCADAIKNSSLREGIVLDTFGGSGSTLIACEKLNRKCRIMELDPVYCQVIIDRWEKYTSKKAKKL